MSKKLITRSVYILGFLGAIATLILAGGAFGILGVIAVVILVGCVVFGVHLYNQREYKQRSQFDLTTLDSISFRYANYNDIKKIYQLDKAVFIEDELIDVDIFLKWNKKNKKTFTCLFKGDELIGYFSLLPLSPETIKRFISGEIKETDFTAVDILTAKQAETECSDLYFFCVVLSKAHKLLFRSMLREMEKEIERFKCNSGLKRLYATAATTAGRELINKFKFKLVQNGIDRVDGHDLFVKPISNIKDIKVYVKRLLLVR